MLLEKLVSRQRELGMTDIQFARMLGIPRSTWQNTRTGVRRIGRRVALATRRAFPDLRSDVDSFLLADATLEAALETPVARPYSTVAVAKLR